MKNKKYLAIGLGASCIAILIGITLLNNKPEPEFAPEAVESTISGSWEEKYSQNTPKETYFHEPEPTGTVVTENDTTQVIITEETEKVVTELNPPVDKNKVQANTKPDTPPKESDKNGRLPSCDKPETETTAPQEQTQPEQTQPPVQEPSDPGDNKHEGQIYDPVFGWITPSPAQGQITDNDGDINKQVGTMD